MRNMFMCIAIALTCFKAFSQSRALTFKQAADQGIRIGQLDSTYKSAVHADSSLAVFKPGIEQETMIKAYQQLLKDLGTFLNKNGFTWNKPTRSFNRVYFSAGGKIDYFLYNFTGNAGDKPDETQQAEFARLLGQFVQAYTFPLKANVKFAQCSPTTYLPGK